MSKTPNPKKTTTRRRMNLDTISLNSGVVANESFDRVNADSAFHIDTSAVYADYVSDNASMVMKSIDTKSSQPQNIYEEAVPRMSLPSSSALE